jgi:hypothetical protein
VYIANDVVHLCECLDPFASQSFLEMHFRYGYLFSASIYIFLFSCLLALYLFFFFVVGGGGGWWGWGESWHNAELYSESGTIWIATSDSAMNYLVLVYVAYIGMMALKKSSEVENLDFSFWHMVCPFSFLPFPWLI